MIYSKYLDIYPNVALQAKILLNIFMYREKIMPENEICFLSIIYLFTHKKRKKNIHGKFPKIADVGRKKKRFEKLHFIQCDNALNCWHFKCSFP